MERSTDIRPFTLADGEGVSRLHRDVWWAPRSMAGWRWLLSNPAHPPDAPYGWVIDGAAGPQAFVGNLIQRLWCGQEAACFATGYSIVVSSEARGAGRSLINAIVVQPGMAAVHTLNANAKASLLYRRMRFEPWPAGSSDVKLTWVVDPLAAVHGRLTREIAARRKYRGVIGTERLLNARLGQRLQRFEAGVEPLTDLSDAGPFATFWDRLRGEGRPIADRSPETLRWRLANPDVGAPPVALVHLRDSAITGWLWGQISKGSEIEVPILDIIDVAALEGERDAIPALMTTVLKGARSIGAAKVRLQVASLPLLRALGPLASRARREGGWGHGFARFAPETADHLRERWRPTPFEGDFSVCLRPAPVRA